MIELVDAADPKLWEVDKESIAEMYLRAEEMARYGREACTKLRRHIGERFDEPIVLSNGWVLKPTTEDKRTGWQKAELRTEVFERFGREVVTADGVPARMLDADTVNKFFDVATGRGRTWRNAGIDLDRYCTVERDQPTVEIVK